MASYARAMRAGVVSFAVRVMEPKNFFPQASVDPSGIEGTVELTPTERVVEALLSRLIGRESSGATS